MPGELDQAIKESAEAPAKASVDGQSVEQHRLREQIEADRYLESKKAAKRKGIAFTLTANDTIGTDPRAASSRSPTSHL